MTPLENTIRKAAAIRGVILGIVLLAFSIASYYVLINTEESALQMVITQTIFSFVIPLIVALIFSFNLRKSIGGYWTFRQAVTGIFIMFVINYAIQVVGKDVAFAKFVEPGMVQKSEAAMMNATTESLKKSGKSQADIAKKKAEIQKKLDEEKNITTGAMIQGYVFTFILLFIPALIFAALLKRNPPEYQTYTDTTQ
ncbi:MAG: DUF4199 domain-containing protein [Bacteroidetes bacterium]|nr:DUF4199 domain-containing protein [Bacteroidota bacterium]